jgi:Fibronectin type III domain
MQRCTWLIGVALAFELQACGKTASSVHADPAMNTTPDVANRTGTATLSWAPPRRNLDGSALNDLAGYYIYYGKNPDDLSGEIRIFEPYATTHTVDHLGPGTYYFKVVAVTANGVKSSETSLVSKKIP